MFQRLSNAVFFLHLLLCPARRRRVLLEFVELEPRLAPAQYRVPYMDFSPYIKAGENPNNGPGQITAQMLTQRMQVLTPYTEGIRIYDCTGDLQPAAQIARSLGLKTAIGAWIGKDPVANQAGIDSLVSQAINGYVDIAIVGSEALLRGDINEATEIGYITQVKSRLQAAGVNIPVTYADTYNVLEQHPNVLASVDVVYANFFPYWEGTAVNGALASLNSEYHHLEAMVPGKQVVVSESGWPSEGSPLGAAVPSTANAAYYFLDFGSWAEANNVTYAYFETYDEPWKLSVEGDVGPHWGLFDTNEVLKPGMQDLFNGVTVPDNWSTAPGPATYDFFAMPNKIGTNLGTFLVTGATDPANTVAVNGVPIPPSDLDGQGAFAYPVTLASGDNTLTVTITNASGDQVLSVTKTVVFDPNLSTSRQELLYVDVVPDGGPAIDGTVVIDTEQNAILGLLPGEHVRGISPDHSEIYLASRKVLSTTTHQLLRTLPFSQEIQASGFLVSRSGKYLYSGSEVVDVASNTLLSSLPLNITISAGYDGAPAAGGPAISSDGSTIFCAQGDSVFRVDTATDTAANTGINLSAPDNYYVFISALALSQDGKQLLVSEYAGSGSVAIYDANTYQFEGQVPLGDFAGGIGTLSGTEIVASSAGNPANGGGGLRLVDLNTLSPGPYLGIPLAENVATFPAANEVFASTGAGLGVDVLTVGSANNLVLGKTFDLGVDRYGVSYGHPRHDQIRRFVFKPAPVDHFVFSVPTNITAGSPATVTLSARDPYDNPVTEYSGTVQITSSDSQAVLPEEVTLSNGVATFGVTLKTSGIQTLTATDTITSTLTGSGILTVNPAAASLITITTPGSATAGTAFSFTVTAHDQFNNTATGYSGTVHFTSSDGAAALPIDSTLSDGVGTFSATLKTAGPQTITATDTGTSSITVTSSPITVSATVATHFAVSAPSSATAGTAFSFTVTAQDPFNNTATGYSGTVHFTSSDSAPALPTDSTLTSGVGNFSAMLKTAGTQALTATDTITNSITGLSAPIAVSAAAATRFAISAPSTVAGRPVDVTVKAFDQFNNLATGYTGTVHLATTDPQGMVPSDYTFTNGTGGDNGVHVFSGSVTLETVGSWPVSVSATGLAGDSHNVSVAPAAASHFTVSAPASSAAGSAFTTTVKALDPYGNTDTNFTGTVHFTSNDLQATLPGEYPFTTGTGNDNGVHTFTNLTTLRTAGNRTVNAAAGAVTGNATVHVTPLAATHLVVGAPASSPAGTAFDVTVTAEDQFGNTDPTYHGPVQLGSDDPQGSVPGLYAFTTGSGGDDGVHTFSSAVTLKTAGSRTVSASSGTLTKGSISVTVTPSTTTHFVVVVPSGGVSFGTPFSVTVTAQDIFGNMATGYTGTVQFSSDDSQATLPGSYTFTTGSGGDNGQHTFHDAVILVTAGNRTINVKEGGESSTASAVSVNVANQPVIDVTSQVVIRYGARKRHGRRTRQTLTITSVGSSVFEGPISIVLDRLSSNSKLVNRTGIVRVRPPRNSPYLNMLLGPDNLLRPGQTVSVTLILKSLSGKASQFKARVLAGVGSR
jgi:exo-beta-1,3-glucanase (GH17 family)